MSPALRLSRTRRNIRGIAISTGVALALVGCSGSDNANNKTDSTRPLVAKATIIQKGDAICARFGSKIPSNVSDMITFMRDSASLSRAEASELKALGRPDADEDKFNAFVEKLENQADDMDQIAPVIAKNPSEMSNPDGVIMNDISAAAEAAKAFGFKNCDTSSSTSTTTSPAAGS